MNSFCNKILFNRTLKQYVINKLDTYYSKLINEENFTSLISKGKKKKFNMTAMGSEEDKS